MKEYIVQIYRDIPANRKKQWEDRFHYHNEEEALARFNELDFYPKKLISREVKVVEICTYQNKEEG